MAKIKLQNIFQEIEGRLGDYVFKKSASGEIIISKVPDMSHVRWSKAQKLQRRRMKEANAYAREAMNDPEMRAHYEVEARRRNKNSPYRLAVSDYFKAPERVESLYALRS